MALSSSSSLAVASILAVLTFSSMQMYKTWLASSQPTTLLGGYLGSALFVFLLTAVGNLETALFGKGFQTKLTEVVLCLGVSLLAAGMVHRVCVTVTLVLSLIGLYYINQVSLKTYVQAAQTSAQSAKKKK